MDMLFLGVDGGGTKTEFLLINDLGAVQGHILKESCHYKQTDFSNFEKVISEGIRELCQMAAIHLDEVTYACLGLPGYGEVKADEREMEKRVAQILGKVPHKIVNDSVVGWAGSLGTLPGVNMVAGTGSIAYGGDQKGNCARAGGWGHVCGDEGSAYWMGKKMIKAFAKQADGRSREKILYETLIKELGLKNDFDMISYVLDDLKENRRAIAQFSKMVSACAEKGDQDCRDILEEAAYEQFLAIRATLEKLDFTKTEAIYVSYSGGVFNAGSSILEPLEKYCKAYDSNIQLMAPRFSPIQGAVLLSVKWSGRLELLETIKKNLN